MDQQKYTTGLDIKFEYEPVVSSTQKKRRKKKKKTTTAEITLHADGQGVTINNISSATALRGAASAAADNIWNVTASEERMRVRAFWLSLTDAERLDLVQLDKEALLEKIRKQRHLCNCSVCGRKKVAIEQELEALYQAYYAEIEAFGAKQNDFVLNYTAGEPLDIESDYGDYYEQYDEIGGGILSVADDLLKNDGRRFVDVMEHLAAQRIQRELPTDHCDGFENEFANEDESFPVLDEEQQLESDQRLADGRRMLQIFAARMFEQRVLNAYREHIARERQQQLLLEIEEEDQAQSLKEQKKQKDKEKKKDKKRSQRQIKEDAEKKRLEELELQKQEKERQQREKMRQQRLEEERRKAEEHRQEIEARMRRLELEEQQEKTDAKTELPQKAGKKDKAQQKQQQQKAGTSTHNAQQHSKNKTSIAAQKIGSGTQTTTLPSPPKQTTVNPKLPPAPGKKVSAPSVPQSLYREPARSVSQPLGQSSPPISGNNVGSPLSLPRIHTPLAQIPSAQAASGIAADTSIPWSRPTTQPQASYLSDFSVQRCAAPLYGGPGWNQQWGTTQPNSGAAPPATHATPPQSVLPIGSGQLNPQSSQPIGTLWSKQSLWSNSTSVTAIRKAAVTACAKISAEGLAVDGFIPSQVLFHSTVDTLNGAMISLNDLYQACDLNSGLSSDFECLRDHVGLITHIRYVKK